MRKMHFDEIVAGIFMILTVIVVILNISMRYFSILLYRVQKKLQRFVYLVCIYWRRRMFQEKMHMGIDIFTQLLPIKYKNGILLL